VIAAAAGTILEAGLRQLLRAGPAVVWLRAQPGTLVRRIAEQDQDGDAHRPWHEAGQMTPEAWLDRETNARAPLYSEVADVTVDVDNAAAGDRPTADVVQEIVAGLSRRESGRV
jgi:shikimate kinase